MVGAEGLAKLAFCAQAELQFEVLEVVFALRLEEAGFGGAVGEVGVEEDDAQGEDRGAEEGVGQAVLGLCPVYWRVA